MSEPFLSEIRVVSFGFAPNGWALCNGQILPINQNQALFSLLGTTYGGDGKTNFALPNFQGRVPMHGSASHVLGESLGESTHTLSVAEMPAHSHDLNSLRADASLPSPSGNLPAYAEEDAYAVPGATVSMAPGAVAQGGGGEAHPNMQPYLVLNFIIALQGIFPSRA